MLVEPLLQVLTERAPIFPPARNAIIRRMHDLPPTCVMREETLLSLLALTSERTVQRIPQNVTQR